MEKQTKSRSTMLFSISINLTNLYSPQFQYGRVIPSRCFAPYTSALPLFVSICQSISSTALALNKHRLCRICFPQPVTPPADSTFWSSTFVGTCRNENLIKRKNHLWFNKRWLHVFLSSPKLLVIVSLFVGFHLCSQGLNEKPKLLWLHLVSLL